MARLVFLLVIVGFAHSKLIDLSCRQIHTFVDGHNSRRLKVAKGEVYGQPAASKMKSVIWDEELAAKAAHWAAKNPNGHNPDRTVGENIYWYSTTASSYKLNADDALEAWFDEHKDFYFGAIKPEDFGGSKQIGHYTQMIWSDSTHVGCGIAQSHDGAWNKFTVVCNYGPPGNYIGQHPYRTDGYGSGKLVCGPVLIKWKRNFTTENLRFLNVDQALADLAYFIQAMKQQPRFADSPVILYGGSYAANMVLWFKQRYPHLVLGTVASSGPIKGQVDFTGYLETVHEAFLSEGGEQCIDVIRQGILETVEALKTEAGRRSLEQAYRLCWPLIDYDDVYELGYFSGLISWRFSGNTPMEKIGGYIAQTAGLTTCWDMRYEALINTYSQPRSNSRAWYFQTCTEYGFFQTAPRIGTVFDPLVWLTVDFYVDICKKAFSERASHCFDMQNWLTTDTIRMSQTKIAARRIVASWLQSQE
ncbi:hypothetical protein MSG28_002927 [Choristoneura fumiferana]|uniref:Uncharacterized protein n=1 Tax=Choristoneura fumiferana TaxID=7141 RepID=A0ACC0JKR5_CHOFU|nr:hypothetical protein MSG28_002927 [Choristoneura fumiferana]